MAHDGLFTFVSSALRALFPFGCSPFCALRALVWYNCDRQLLVRDLDETGEPTPTKASSPSVANSVSGCWISRARIFHSSGNIARCSCAWSDATPLLLQITYAPTHAKKQCEGLTGTCVGAHRNSEHTCQEAPEGFAHVTILKCMTQGLRLATLRAPIVSCYLPCGQCVSCSEDPPPAIPSKVPHLRGQNLRG